ncbi:hypothetical protein GCM10010472_70730 [Pseudonocardia halophobica]|uniref:Uncharacterized protein n=1 Tax=Pseudonocardia halophobica TaxID=29401 RepID=A0A9W6L3L2_9PSEU|nr:hypothetical protein GCM10017577_34110 [Pseudonocardia halophobica]
MLAVRNESASTPKTISIRTNPTRVPYRESRTIPRSVEAGPAPDLPVTGDAVSGLAVSVEVGVEAFIGRLLRRPTAVAVRQEP